MTALRSLVLHADISRRDRKMILTSAAAGLKVKIEIQELKVMRHERFLECPLPAFAADRDTRKDQLTRDLRYLGELRSAYVAAQEALRSLDKLEAEETGHQVAAYLNGKFGRESSTPPMTGGTGDNR